MKGSRAGGLRRYRALAKPELLDRWGHDAAAKFDRAGTLYSFGGFGAVAMLALFLASSAAGWHHIAIGALATGFLIFVPSMGVASMMMFSLVRNICRRYDISPRSKPPLSIKALKSAASFDAWLIAHGRQPTIPHPHEIQP